MEASPAVHPRQLKDAYLGACEDNISTDQHAIAITAAEPYLQRGTCLLDLSMDVLRRVLSYFDVYELTVCIAPVSRAFYQVVAMSPELLQRIDLEAVKHCHGVVRYCP